MMGSQSPRNWSKYEEIVAYDEDPFNISTEITPLDFRCPSLGWDMELPVQESTMLDAGAGPNFMEATYPSTDTVYSCMDALPNPGPFQIDFNGLDVWNDQLGSLLYPDEKQIVSYKPELEPNQIQTMPYVPAIEPDQKQIVLYENTPTGGDVLMTEEEKMMTMMEICREEKKKSSASQLTRETIAQYFYMPISQAAKELKIGLTLLKKRCRELGISRWPHRKLISLQTLIDNLKEMRSEGTVDERMLRDAALEMLEKERKLLEEMPDLQLDENTRKLRQACFKSKYVKKKRATASMMEC